MTINGPAIVLLAFYVALADKRSIPRRSIGGTVQNDCLKEFMAQHAWLVPPRPAMRIVTDMIEFCAREVPRWNSVSISGYHIREAGSTAAQELAFTLADGLAYVESCLERGLDVDSFAPRLSFFFDVHNDFFEEIAKLRAARRLWARFMKERYGAKKAESMKLRTHAQTAGVSLTAQQPYNNVVRVALQALAAVLGGTQSLHTNSLDETYALPTEESVTIALRTQQIIAHESGAANTIDPLGGSYYVEWMTDQLEREALAFIRRIDEMGGMVSAIEKGYPQREIAASAYRFQREVDAGERVMVGVNRYAASEQKAIPLLRIDEAAQRTQVENLAKVKAARDKAAAFAALAAVREAARGKGNLMPPIIDAARAYCTEQEILRRAPRGDGHLLGSGRVLGAQGSLASPPDSAPPLELVELADHGVPLLGADHGEAALLEHAARGVVPGGRRRAHHLYALVRERPHHGRAGGLGRIPLLLRLLLHAIRHLHGAVLPGRAVEDDAPDHAAGTVPRDHHAVAPEPPLGVGADRLDRGRERPLDQRAAGPRDRERRADQALGRLALAKHHGLDDGERHRAELESVGEQRRVGHTPMLAQARAGRSVTPCRACPPG